MADAQSNIKVSIDTTEALASIKNLQRQISAFHTSMAKSGAAANAVTAGMQQNLVNSINATGKFTAQMRTIKTTTESFTNSLEKNKFSLGEYFRYAGGASKSFGKLFKTEFDTINKVARENVKDLQTQYIKLGRDANGAMKAISVRPLSLDMNDLATKTMIASERQALLNQLLKQGSTNLLNFGKNTQWAGRQLMVGFTIPLLTLGSAAAKTFMDMETQAIRFKKVYGDLFTPKEETSKALEDIQNLGKEFTKYGIAVSATVGLAAEAAAAGFKGLDLQRQTAAATKLSILGQVESQKALETTIALQNAFSMSSADLATNIDFLNAVENQTVLSLDDMSTAIPKAAPVIQQLGGDVKDLAFFMTAMKEGGINASEGANALKSGLASIINPTGKANEMLMSFGINTKNIVESNRGNLKKTVVDFATALNQLDPLNRAQAIEQMFGKFQFARLSTLFANVTKEGTQASRVLDLAGSSVQELASLSEKELGMTSESAMNKFKGAVENLKLSLVPVGEEFLKAVTPIAEFVTKILDKFNNLGDGTKKIIVTITAIVAGLGPVLLMTFGLLANGIANIIKGFTSVKSLFNKTGASSTTLGNEVRYMTIEQRNAAAVAASLDQVHNNLAQTFTSETAAVEALTRAYQRSIAAQKQFSGPIISRSGAPKKFAKGKPYVVGGTGNRDSELSLLMPGETVIPTDRSKKYGALINGIIADNIPGYKRGKGSVTGNIGGYEGSFSRKSSMIAIEERLAGLDSAARAEVAAALPSIMDSLKGTSISLETFSNEIKKQIDSGLIELKKSQIGGFGEKSYSAPKGISEKTKTMDWPSRAAEEEAIRRAIAPFNPTEAQSKNIIGRDASHISQALATGPTGEKIWDPENLQADSAALNKYMEQAKGRMQKFAASTEKADALISKVAKDLGIAEKVVKDRLSRLSQGNQPQTRADYALLSGFASQDIRDKRNTSPYMAAGAKAVADIRVKDNSYVEALAKGDVTAYSKVVKKNSEDIYPQSRKRKSPHPLAAKDGIDDARAYEQARQKETNKRRSAYRPQGPAPIGTQMPAGATQLGIVAPLTAAEKRRESRRQAKTSVLGKAKSAGGRLNSFGGGMGMMGANIGLSMLPDFAGKGVLQGGLAGANLGMMFGPYGMAAGAAIGTVTSAVSALIAKQKELKAIAEAPFKSSADAATFFGNAVVDTTMKMGSLKGKIIEVGSSVGTLSKNVSITNEELTRFSELVTSLPEDSSLKRVVESLTDESNPDKINELAKAFVTTQVAIGQINTDQAQKLLDLLLSVSNHSAMVGSSFINLSTQTQAVSQTINAAAWNSQLLGTSLMQLVGAASNSTSLAQIKTIIDGIGASSITTTMAVNALKNAYLSIGNKEASEGIALLGKVKGINKAQIALLAAAGAQGFGEKLTNKTDPKELVKRAEAFLAKKEEQLKRSSPGFKTKEYKSLEEESSITKKQIALLKKKKKVIDDQLKQQEKITNELKRQNDYTKSQASLDQKIVEAKLTGNFIEAANLLQEKAKNTAEFNQETKKSELQAKADALQAQIDALQLKNDEIVTAIGDAAQKQADAVADAANKIVDAINGGVFTADSTFGNYSTGKKAPANTNKVGGPTVNQTTVNKKTGERELLVDGVFETTAANVKGGYSTLSLGKVLKIGPNKTDDMLGVQTNDVLGRKTSGSIRVVSLDPVTGKFQFVIEKANGGYIGNYAPGGNVKGPGTAKSDSIPAMLSNGEYVVKASSVAKYGTGFMDKINAGKFAEGGKVDANKAKLDAYFAKYGQIGSPSTGDSNYAAGLKTLGSGILKVLSPSNVDKNKQSDWSKTVHGFTNFDDKLGFMKNHPALAVSNPFRTAVGNIIGGDGQWNDYTSIASTFLGPGAIRAGFRATKAGIGLAKSSIASIPKIKNYKNFMEETAGMVTRANYPYPDKLLPRDNIGAFGPGKYFSPKEVAGGYESYGGYGYAPLLSAAEKAKAFIKNYRYADASELSDKLKASGFDPELMNLSRNNPVIDQMIKAGVVGVKGMKTGWSAAQEGPKYAGEFTNWMIGYKKGWGLKNIFNPITEGQFAKDRAMKAILDRLKEKNPKPRLPLKNGGLITGPGTGTSDSISASLGYAGGGSIRVSNGEYVVKASSVKDYGLATMNSINNGTAKVDEKTGNTVYNINMPITSNASDPKAVGDYVIKQLKLVVDKNNKGNAVKY